MKQYLVRRIIQAVPLLLGISLVSFFLIHAAPGDPAMMFIDPNIDPADMQQMRSAYGLDRPVHIQYLSWLTKVLRGDLGNSFANGKPVLERILSRIPATLELTFCAMVLTWLIAIPLGIVSATRQYSALDYTATTFAFMGVSLPNFWFGMLLIVLFGVNLGWLPTMGRMPFFGSVTVAARLKHLVMPVLVMALAGLASLTRHTRSSMLEVIRQDYINTARAKGLREQVVIYRHALKNALIPIITIFGLSIPALLGSSLIVEQLFGWPGMARLTVTSVFKRDYPVIMGTLLVSAGLVILGNLVADIAYGLVDPRVKYD